MTHRTTLLCAPFIVLLLPAAAQARRGWVADIPNGRTVSCHACHANNSNGPLNAFGARFLDLRGDWTMLYALDSDGDGETNGQELGDPCGRWVRGASPDRTTPLSSPGDSAQVSGAPTMSCTGGSDAGASPPPDGGPVPTMATPIGPDDYPPTQVQSACTASGAPARGAAAGWGAWAWLGLLLIALVRGRRPGPRASARPGERPRQLQPQPPPPVPKPPAAPSRTAMA